MTPDNRLVSERFPRSSQYHPEWVLANASGGANALWVTEWLTTALDLRPGMRVLDLGCGRASSSIFLRREFGVQVWATDLWFSAAENMQRIQDAGVEEGVFPLHVDARSLPFAPKQQVIQEEGADHPPRLATEFWRGTRLLASSPTA